MFALLYVQHMDENLLQLLLSAKAPVEDFTTESASFAITAFSFVLILIIGMI